MTDRLTVNLGVRYDYQSPWLEKDDQLTFFDAEATDPLTGRKGIVRLVGRDGGSRYQTDPDRNNIAPRLGFAWQFTKPMVLRGGYGVVYYPGSGGIGSAPSDLGGGGFLTSTPVNLVGSGTPPAAPNTPPPGASLRSPFNSGYFEPPATAVGASVTTAFRDLETPHAQMWNVSLQRELPGRMIGKSRTSATRHEKLWINISRNAVPSGALARDGARRAGAESILWNHPDRRRTAHRGEHARVTTAEAVSALRRRHALPRFGRRLLVPRPDVTAGAAIREAASPIRCPTRSATKRTPSPKDSAAAAVR